MLSSTPTALVAAMPTLFRQGLLAVLREQCPALRLTLTANAAEAAELMTQHAFGLLVLDGALPGLNLTALLASLRRARPAQRLLVLADPGTPAQRADARAWPGTRLLMPAHVPPHALAAALAPWLHAPTGNYSPGPPQIVPPYAVVGRFSRRELEVLRLVVEDCCNEEIAARLFINVRTVESHRRNLLQKTGARTVVGLAARAVREGWV
ncbi:helix-turn-helix transcriptional regulator [Hymenobacter ruricola]|uniref:Response regulator transcription factor n=1 Tax=Hymenobacter ruricola TaxID=2791023 RepID=A0ABS0IA44_9BACT|nr:response regulator transcription factor [Hymenobacter ruricola]MBF9223457.1 response regulator transcription factor [Hymenobacter ruricola]